MDKFLTDLGHPFPQESIEARPGATMPPKEESAALGRAQALLYVDPRHYYYRLNDVAGMDWEDSYSLFPGRKMVVICELKIAGRVRTGDGECAEDDANALTVASAQAFKRACAKWGLGAYLYDSPDIWAEAKFGKLAPNGKRPCFGFTDQGHHEVAQAVARWYESSWPPALTAEDLQAIENLSARISAARTMDDLGVVADLINHEPAVVKGALRQAYIDAKRIIESTGGNVAPADAGTPATKKREAAR